MNIEKLRIKNLKGLNLRKEIVINKRQNHEEITDATEKKYKEQTKEQNAEEI
ncbi:unnamed protein product [Paramecium sonneborni]|uniref:Uncharacterized protein n=1 Tax=Paramecium sonneborni TaxID=65129 RepID=A0A8S1KXQ2_9CILI|nr:unnamed protein product [Paramecium sonneborni]